MGLYILLILIVIFCCVRCSEMGDQNLFIIEAPPDDFRSRRTMKIYWNVPTIQCKSKGIPFKNLESRYGIVQNTNDSFIGEKIAILYDPGIFPAILKKGNQAFLRNGGVPQEGDLTRHLDEYQRFVQEKIDEDFDGLLIIDFESWRPIFRQNFGVLLPYKNTSFEIERSRHWFWPDAWVKQEAIRRFEESARVFMELTLNLTKRLRRKSTSGYYAYPYCFNMSPNSLKSDCAVGVESENNRMSWLWRNSDILFPSLYIDSSLTITQQKQMIYGRLKEAKRVKKKNTKVVPYFWYKYKDGGFLDEEHLKSALKAIYNSGADGIIIWGSSNDVNTKSKCLDLQNYTEKVLGPNVLYYTDKLVKSDTELVFYDDESDFLVETVLS